MRYNEFDANRFLQNRLPERRICNQDFIWNTTATRTDIFNTGYNPYDNKFDFAKVGQPPWAYLEQQGEINNNPAIARLHLVIFLSKISSCINNI